MFRKIVSLSLCAVMTCCLFSSCGETQSQSSESYYGQAVKEVNRKDIYLIYDGNFVSDEEMDVLANYYTSIQKKDTELFCSTQPEFYTEYLEENQSGGIDDYITSEYEYLEKSIGKNFDFSQIEVTDCGNSENDRSFEEIRELLDGICTENGIDKKFSESIKDEKYVVFDLSALSPEGEEYALKQVKKYIFSCDDGIYIF